MLDLSADLIFSVNNSVTADDIINQIKTLYPGVKEAKKGAVDIKILIDKDIDPMIIQEIGNRITAEEIIEFRDKVTFSNL